MNRLKRSLIKNLQNTNFADHQNLQINNAKIGVLLTNVGTPENYKFWGIRRFLSEFLSDRRVVEIPTILWKPFLELFILNARSGRVGRYYRSIWNHELNEAPLRTIMKLQALKTANRFLDESVEIEWAFRYGAPSIQSGIENFLEKGCDRIILFPLYPQYSAATTASTVDKVFEVLSKQRFQLTLRIVPPFYDNCLYVKVIANSIMEHIGAMKTAPDVIVVSYHGVPLKCHELGDPYGLHCLQTTNLIRRQLSVQCEIFSSFQSQFGISEWLKPSTEYLISRLAEYGMKRIVIVAPGFIGDCLETLKEIKEDFARIFRENGGEELIYVPCLNSSDECIDIIENLIRIHMNGFKDLNTDK